MKCKICNQKIITCDGNCNSPFEIGDEVWCSVWCAEISDSHFCSLECLNIRRSEVIK